MARFAFDTTADEDAAIAVWLAEANALPGEPRTAEDVVLQPSRRWVTQRVREQLDRSMALDAAKIERVSTADYDAIRAILDRYPDEAGAR